MTDNLALWNTVEKTDPKHTKPITGKSYQGNSPKPHWIIRKATETFGPCGIGWGFTVEERVEDGAMIAPGFYEKLHVAKVTVWYEWNGKRGQVEHIGGTTLSGQRSSGKPYTDEDAPKKSVTDALIKALSMIGFAGDIFLGRYDDSNYLSEVREEFQEQERESSLILYIRESWARIEDKNITAEKLHSWWTREADTRRAFGLEQSLVDQMKARVVARLAELRGERAAA